MPRTNYVPDADRPYGFAFPYIEQDRHEDKPTVEVDMFAPGLKDALIEAVCVALECWDPVLVAWEDVPPTKNPDGTFALHRKIPRFRGRHADKVRKFRDDIFGYMDRNHESDWQNQHFLKIANKYVHIRPKTDSGQNGTRHPRSFYTRETIKPWLVRSDPEWDAEEVARARNQINRTMADPTNTYAMLGMHEPVKRMLQEYDANHGTAITETYIAEVNDLYQEQVHPWEHMRLVAYYVQGVADTKPPKKWADPRKLASRKPVKATARPR